MRKVGPVIFTIPLVILVVFMHVGAAVLHCEHTGGRIVSIGPSAEHEDSCCLAGDTKCFQMLAVLRTPDQSHPLSSSDLLPAIIASAFDCKTYLTPVMAYRDGAMSETWTIRPKRYRPILSIWII